MRSRVRSAVGRGNDSGAPNMGHVRLRADVEAYREEFETLVARAEGEDTFWKEDVENLLQNVDEALAQGRVDDGWRHFHAAQRLETHGLEALDAADPDANALETRARVVRAEALDVLSGWRAEAVGELLGRQTLTDDVSGEAVREASSVLHDHYERVHLKRHYLQTQFNQLFWLGVVAGLLFVVLSLLPYFASVPFLQPPFEVMVVEAGESGVEITWESPNVESAGFAVFVGLAGVVGASLFGMRSLRTKAQSTKVAQRITGLALTWARGLIGAISALVFYFLLQTPFVSVWGKTPAVFVVVGFAAGYSERMVTRAVETVSGATTGTTKSEN